MSTQSTIPVLVPLYNQTTHKLTFVVVMLEQDLVETGLAKVTQPPVLSLPTDTPLKKVFWEAVAAIAPFLGVLPMDMERMFGRPKGSLL